MKNKFFLFALMLATMFLSTMPSCKKDESNTVLQQNSEATFSGDADSSSENCTRGSVKPVNHNSTYATPRCITEMMNDPEFEFFDFENMAHCHALDTSGIYTYVIPSRYFDTEILFVGVINNQIIMRCALSLPLDFDYDYYSNNHLNAFVYAYSYDYSEEFFDGYWDVYNSTFVFNYVNHYLSEGGMAKEMFDPLLHWKDMNLCGRILSGAQVVFDIGLTVASLEGGPLSPFLGKVLRGANAFGWTILREKACR